MRIEPKRLGSYAWHLRPFFWAQRRKYGAVLDSALLSARSPRLIVGTALVVVPLFAFFNAGIAIDSEAVASLWTSTSFGIMAALFIGKQTGVFGAAWLAVRLGIGELPRGVTGHRSMAPRCSLGSASR